jgi:hypothetical protein
VPFKKLYFRPLQKGKSHLAKPQEWLKHWAFGQSKNHPPTQSFVSIDGRLFGGDDTN